jgi:mevalonate pyrophosphate decarboxylase
MSPIHDKKAIISMMDELKPQDMAELVELIKSKQPKHQTAVEWLVEQLTPSITLRQKYIDEIKEQAKEIEKAQSEKYADYVLELFEKNTNPMSFNLWNETIGDNT